MLKFLRRTLLSLAILLAIVAALFLYQLSQIGPGRLPASDPQIGFVKQLFPEFDMEVQESYLVRGNWSGDIESGFVADISASGVKFFDRGDLLGTGNLSTLHEDAVRFVADGFGSGQLDWFPSTEAILGEGYFLLPIAIENRNGYIDSARLILVQPDARKLYYVWLKY